MSVQIRTYWTATGAVNITPVSGDYLIGIWRSSGGGTRPTIFYSPTQYFTEIDRADRPDDCAVVVYRLAKPTITGGAYAIASDQLGAVHTVIALTGVSDAEPIRSTNADASHASGDEMAMTVPSRKGCLELYCVSHASGTINGMSGATYLNSGGGEDGKSVAYETGDGIGDDNATISFTVGTPASYVSFAVGPRGVNKTVMIL